MSVTRFDLSGAASSAVLHVCVTCRAGRAIGPDEAPPGALLHARLRALAPGLDAIREQRCLAACGRGCTAALTAPGKWGMLLGGLTDAHAADLLDYLGRYDAAPTGTVLPSRRAPSLRDAVIGRIPA